MNINLSLLKAITMIQSPKFARSLLRHISAVALSLVFVATASAAVVTDPVLSFGSNAIDPLSPDANAGVLDATVLIANAATKADLAAISNFGVVQDFAGFTGRSAQGAGAGVPAVNYFSFTDPNRPDVRISSLSGNGSGGAGDSNASTSGATIGPPAGTTDQYLGSNVTNGGFTQTIEFGTYNTGDNTFAADRAVSAAGFMITRINNVATNWTATFYDANDGILDTQTTGIVQNVNSVAVLFGRISTSADIRRIRIVFQGAVNTFMDDLGFTSTPSLLPGDADGDGDVDQTDYNIWRSNFASTGLGASGGDFNLNGANDAPDYVIWRKNFTGPHGSGMSSAVPEPAVAALAASACLVGLAMRRRTLRTPK